MKLSSNLQEKRHGKSVAEICLLYHVTHLESPQIFTLRPQVREPLCLNAPFKLLVIPRHWLHLLMGWDLVNQEDKSTLAAL